MRLEIWDPVVDDYVHLNEKNYRGQMQSGAHLGLGERMVYIYY